MLNPLSISTESFEERINLVGICCVNKDFFYRPAFVNLILENCGKENKILEFRCILLISVSINVSRYFASTGGRRRTSW